MLLTTYIPEHGGLNLVIILGHDAGIILEVSYILLFLQLLISLIASLMVVLDM